MTEKGGREENNGIHCFLCQKTDRQGVLLSGRKEGKQLWVCPRCLPMLIHGSQ